MNSKKTYVSEQDIAEGLRKGDNHAMREFYASFGGMLTGVCCRYLADDDDVKDTLQETLISIIKNIHSFEYKGKGSLRAWAVRITVNHALSFLRKKQRDTALFVNADSDIADEETPPDIEDIPADTITEMIRQLPDGYRMVFNLYVIEGKSHKEIAQTLGIKEVTSASQLHRAKAILTKKINEYRKQQRGDITTPTSR